MPAAGQQAAARGGGGVQRLSRGGHAALPRDGALLALGRIAHDAVLGALGLRRAAYPFGHAARHALPSGVVLFDSYHCSRYNTNTGRLTRAMFRAVFADIAAHLRRPAPAS
jgi:uracil-DNA glycosylase